MRGFFARKYWCRVTAANRVSMNQYTIRIPVVLIPVIELLFLHERDRDEVETEANNSQWPILK